jgi:hypothetical protein
MAVSLHARHFLRAAVLLALFSLALRAFLGAPL